MKAFIFDLDGVIVFTDKFHYQAWKKMADRMGIYFDETINNRLRGVSRAESLEIILEKYEGTPLTAEQKALQSVDAGHIGKYDSCMSCSQLISYWRPLDGKSPADSEMLLTGDFL